MNAAFSALANATILSALLAAAIWLALRLTPRRTLNAATRYAIWWIILAATLALPVLYLPPGLTQPAAASGVAPITTKTLPLLTSSNYRAARAASAAGPLPWSPIQIAAGPWLPRILAAWALASAVLLFRLLLSYAAMHRKSARAAAPANLQGCAVRWLEACAASRRAVRLAVSADISVPAATGPFRPSILIPIQLFDELTETELDQIGLHEAAHLARYDDYSMLLQRFMEALFWLHPVVRWTTRQVDLEREIACDDIVAAATGRPRAYAACLARMVALCGCVRPSLAASNAVRRSHLARRVQLLVLKSRDAKSRDAGPRLFAARLITCVVTCAAALVALSSLMGKAPSIVAFASPGPAPAAALTKTSTGDPKPQQSPDPQKENTVNHPIAKNRNIAQRMLLAAAVATALAGNAAAVTSDAPQDLAQPAPGRLIAMYFNMASLPKDSRTSAAAAAQKFIASQMQSNDAVAIVAYDAGSVRVMQDFSSDHALLQSAIDKLDTAQISPEAAGLDASGLAGMPDAVRMLGAVQGPKAFIWFTNGPGAAHLASSRIPEIASAAAAANVRIYAVDVRGSINLPPR